MRPLALLLALFLAGCQTTRVYEVPSIPDDAATLVITDREPPRVLYASAWGAFGEYGWDIVEHDSDALRFRATLDDLEGAVEVTVETDAPREVAEQGRIVASVDPEAPDAQAVFEFAVETLASVPGRIAFR